MQELKLTIDRTLDRRNLEKALAYYRDKDSKDGLSDLIGELEKLPPEICPVDGCNQKLHWEPDNRPREDQGNDPLHMDYAYTEYLGDG